MRGIRYWAWDIETEDWDTFVYGHAISTDGRSVAQTTEYEVRQWYLSLDSEDIVLAHNGGAYDFMFLLSICADLQWTARMAGSAIVSMRAKGCAECRDSMRLFRAGLQGWTGQKDALDLPCVCGRDCGGYCSIRRDMPRALRDRMRAYCAQDCRALLEAWCRDIERLADERLEVWAGKKPRLTLGSVAWHTSAAMGGFDAKEKASWSEYEAGRAAYYGGRCEVGSVRAKYGRRYDIHSAYPWALTLPVPVGPSTYVRGSVAYHAYTRGYQGAYQCAVRAPESEIPLLPHRARWGSSQHRLHAGRLVWATGHLAGTWTLEELRKAEEHGAEITAFGRARVWLASEAIHEEYVRHIYRLKDAATKSGDEHWTKIVKFFANSLSGKLAQKCEVSQLIINPEKVMPDWDPVGTDPRIYARKMTRLSPCMRPIQAATLTARVRGVVLDRLARHEGHWLYCDTDSTYLQRRDDTDVHPDRLGAWGDEGLLREWEAIGPKLYRFRAPDGDGGFVPHVRGKGVPRMTWDDFDALRDGDTIRKEGGAMGVRSAGLYFQKKVVIRSNRTPENKAGTRVVDPETGRTRPLHRLSNGEYR